MVSSSSKAFLRKGGEQVHGGNLGISRSPPHCQVFVLVRRGSFSNLLAGTDTRKVDLMKARGFQMAASAVQPRGPVSDASKNKAGGSLKNHKIGAISHTLYESQNAIWTTQELL